MEIDTDFDGWMDLDNEIDWLCWLTRESDWGWLDCDGIVDDYPVIEIIAICLCCASLACVVNPREGSVGMSNRHRWLSVFAIDSLSSLASSQRSSGHSEASRCSMRSM